MERDSKTAPSQRPHSSVQSDHDTTRTQSTSSDPDPDPDLALEVIRIRDQRSTTESIPEVTYDLVRNEGSPTAEDILGQSTEAQSQPEDKGKAPTMSYPGDYHYQSRMGGSAYGGQRSTSSGNSQHLDPSRTTTGSSSSGSSSSASTPRHGTEGTNPLKKDDKSCGGAGSGVGSGGSGASSSRSRLVAGVFVRY
jgi:hypothetical protein